MTGQIPSFAELEANLSNLVKEQGFGGSVVWVFREDCVHMGRRGIAVHVPEPDSNRDIAARLYARGVSLGLGISAEVLCSDGGRFYCCLIVPEDRSHADQMMLNPDSLRCCVPQRVPSAIRFRSRMGWKLVRVALGRNRSRWVGEIPSKTEAKKSPPAPVTSRG